MDKTKATLAIYGIQDRLDSETPYFVHDHAITLMDKGKVIKHLTLERLSRKKHDNTLHKQLYQILKDEGLLAPDDFDLVFPDNVVGRAFISSCGKIRFEAPLNKTLQNSIEKGRCWWLDHERNAYSLNHELSHIGSCLPFFGNFKENSLLVHFDGGASLSNFSAWHYKNGKINLVNYHWDYKYLSSFFNANALVFGIIGARFDQQNSVPGKMMGLASYGNYSPELEEWLKRNDYFKDIWRKKSFFFKECSTHFGVDIQQLSTDTPFLQDIVATLQHVFVRDLLKILTHLKQQTNTDFLYYSGGSTLNIVANTSIIESEIFSNLFIPPCPEDSGLSLGAAAYLEWLKHGDVAIHSPYLNNWGLIENKEINLADISAIANELINGKVIGICNGDGEIGPRALGNRSIIALANSRILAQKVSMEHKGREWYRPVAPIMLEKNAQYFTGSNSIHTLSNFMLLDFDILPPKQKEMEGVVHVDGTARIQCIRDKRQNPFMFELLSFLDKNHNIKALINTSFNKKGEPIVHSADDAITSAKNMKLDGIVLNGSLMMF